MLATLTTIRQLTNDTKKLTSLYNTSKDANTKHHIKEQISLNKRVVCELKQHASDFIDAQPIYISVAIKEYYFNCKSWERTVTCLPCTTSVDSLRMTISRHCNAWNIRKQ